jgi:hypothetical protein
VTCDRGKVIGEVVTGGEGECVGATSFRYGSVRSSLWLF